MLETALRTADALRNLPSPPERRALREKAGLSQGAIADAVGVRRSTISRWESGDRVPRGKLALTYSTVLDEITDHLAKVGRLTVLDPEMYYALEDTE